METENSKYIWIFLHLPKTGGTTFLSHLEKNLKYDEEFVHIGNWGDEYRNKNNKTPFEQRSLEEREKAIVLGGHSTYYGIHELVPNKIPRYFIFLREPGSWMVSSYNYQLALTPDLKKSFEEFCDWYFNYNTRFAQIFLRSKRIRKLDYDGKLYIFRERFKRYSKRIGFFFIYQYLYEKGNIFQYYRMKKLLNKCYYVGIVEKLNEDIKFLCNEIGISNDFSSVNVTNSNSKNKIEKSLFTLELQLNNKIKLDDQIKKKCELGSNYDFKLYEYGKKINKDFFNKKI